MVREPIIPFHSIPHPNCSVIFEQVLDKANLASFPHPDPLPEGEGRGNTSSVSVKRTAGNSFEGNHIGLPLQFYATVGGSQPRAITRDCPYNGIIS
jgi:hypothetical protein